MAKPEEISLDDLFKKLNSSPSGLSDSDAESRLQTYGYNEVAEKKQNLLLKFLKKFWAPIPWMLELTITTYNVPFAALSVFLTLYAIARFHVSGAVAYSQNMS